jgi:SAM-dependent methyltransferase
MGNEQDLAHGGNILGAVVDAVQERSGAAGLDLPPNLARAYALVLAPGLGAAVTVGTGNGELAAHLALRDAQVTLIDSSQAAIALAQSNLEDVQARLVLAEPSELGQHVPPATQDAIFLTDVVECMSSSELRWLFRACRTALRPGGACCILTTDRLCRPSVRSALAEERSVNLFEIGALRGLLAESFEAVDAFTWNGTERFEEPGRCDELYALARADDPYVMKSLPIRQARAAAIGASGWTVATVADGVSVPSRFLFRASMHVRAAPPDSVIHLLFKTADPRRFFWRGVRPQTFVSNPAQLMLASEGLTCVGDASWADVESVVMRIRSSSAAECDIRLSDVRIVSA